MNLLGIDVRGLDVMSFLLLSKAVYLATFLAWVIWIWRSRRLRMPWLPIGFALLVWLEASYPLQRVYGLNEISDRLRNVWWCASTAAGNAPWESGVVGQQNLEPFWAALVAALAGFDPARVLTLYPFLPALSISLVGVSFFSAFRGWPPGDKSEPLRSSLGPLRTTLVAFFVFLVATGPLDYLNPFRGFFTRTFLLKPNHALALALVPLLVKLLATGPTWRKTALAAVMLGALGWSFIFYWGLFCCGLVLYVLVLALRRKMNWRREAIRLGIIALASAVLVGPYLYYLLTTFPVASLAPGEAPDDPQLSLWGDRPPRTASLFFLVTTDLGVVFFLGLMGAWSAWRSGRPFDLLWLAQNAACYAVWTVNYFLLITGRARQSDEIYYFLLFTSAVNASLGALEALRMVPRLLLPGELTEARLARSTAVALLLALPLTLPWWWDPSRMDVHFQNSLHPIPQHFLALGEWIRTHSAGSDIFFGGRDVAIWIPALSGRRVLRTGMPLLNTPQYWDECGILFPETEEATRAILARLGVKYVVFDSSLMEEHALESDHLDRLPFYRLAFQPGGFPVYAVEAGDGSPSVAPSALREE